MGFKHEVPAHYGSLGGGRFMATKSLDESGGVDLRATGARKLPTLRAAYSDRTAALMAALSQNAYIAFDAPRSKKKRRASGSSLPLKEGGEALLTQELRSGGFELISTFNIDDIQAYLCKKNHELGVLAFRGTANFQDWLIDLDALPIRLEQFKNIKVHQGFWDAYAHCMKDIEAQVDAHIPPELPLYITGHSLGGALAQIASAVLERDNLAACYTFGSPRVATLDFDGVVKCPHYRVVNSWDLVPSVPGPPYAHTGDPRLLLPSRPGLAPLRRDQSKILRSIVDLYASVASVFTRRLLVIDDHMIWNYRKRLEAIVAARNEPIK